MASSGGFLFYVSEAQPSLAEAYKTGKSSCSSDAPRFAKRSNTKLSTSSHLSSLTKGLSTLFKSRIGLSPYLSALARTNFVWASGPSPASTTKIAPSTIPTTRSTSPPKSACPGVSTMFSSFSFHGMDVIISRINTRASLILLLNKVLNSANEILLAKTQTHKQGSTDFPNPSITS
ncbi:hypothetical protein LXL04_020275, partial [Taraxacum kok-saghyz]